MAKRAVIVAAAVLGVLFLVFTLSSGGNVSKPVTFAQGGVSVRAEYLDSGLAGDRVKVTLKPEALGGHIAAGVRLEVSGELVPTAPVNLPRPLTKKTLPLPVYAAGTARVEVPVKRATGKPGQATVKVSYQTCDKTACLPAVVDRTVVLVLK